MYKRNKVKEFIRYGGVSREEYLEIKPYIADENLKIWRVVSIILSIFAILMVIFAFAFKDYFYNDDLGVHIDDAHIKYAIAYAILAIYSSLLTIYLWFFSEKFPKTIAPIIGLTNIGTLAFFALTCTTLDRANCSVIYCALVVIAALITVRNPLKCFSLISVSTILYIVMVCINERSLPVFADDLIYGITFGLLAIIFGNFFNHVRIRGFSLRYYVEQQRDIDSLTGVRSKLAYDREVRRIMERLYQNAQCEPFALAIFDVNGLKVTNDTYGHELGDELLVRSAQLICDFFRNSSVYRIGGDEFAVIIKGEDYRARNEIIRKFKAHVYEINDDSKSLLDDIPIACGMATYDPQNDIDYITVFSRADAIMYDDKRLIKSRNKYLKDAKR